MAQDLLDIYSDYLIAQSQYATATGLSSLLEGSISHDQVTRFLNRNVFDSKDLWGYVKPQVRQAEQEQGGVLIIDDAIEEKPYTDENTIVNWHFSHAKGRCVKGINLLSCLVRYGDWAVPVGYQVIHKDIYYCDLKTKRTVRKASVTKNEHFRSLVQRACANQIKFDYTLADNWFGSKDNMEYIHHELGKKFVFGLKANRLVALSDEARKKGQYQNLSTLDWKDGEARRAWLKDLSLPVSLIKKVFKNEDGSTGTLYLVTNDLENGADRIYEIYQKRWRVEEYHKSIKQNSSLEKSPTRTERSQKNHLFASLIGYCKLEFLKMKTHLNHFALKYKLILKANQIAYLELRKLRESNAIST
jgi:DDE superfamily endonuclease